MTCDEPASKWKLVKKRFGPPSVWSEMEHFHHTQHDYPPLLDLSSLTIFLFIAILAMLAAKAIGPYGKPAGMNATMAPALWASGKTDAVLADPRRFPSSSRSSSRPARNAVALRADPFRFGVAIALGSSQHLSTTIKTMIGTTMAETTIGTRIATRMEDALEP